LNGTVKVGFKARKINWNCGSKEKVGLMIREIGNEGK